MEGEVDEKRGFLKGRVREGRSDEGGRASLRERGGSKGGLRREEEQGGRGIKGGSEGFLGCAHERRRCAGRGRCATSEAHAAFVALPGLAAA